MYVVTNRDIHENAKGLEKFSREPNSKGPNELRLMHVDDDDVSQVRELKDALTASELQALVSKHKLDIDQDREWFRSLQVACELFERARKEKKHLLFFVHGYNNDMSDVLKTAKELQEQYDLLVVPFSWPANGGGALSGTAAYIRDKDDARISATALSRTVEKIAYYHELLTHSLRSELDKKAKAKHPGNSDAARALYNRLLESECRVRISLLCHSMGNYVCKHASLSSTSALRSLTFDNIALVAADVNNPGHAEWVSTLPTRNRLYVVVNENDGPLGWSRRKPGEEQLPRLGHHLKNLYAANAYYIDVTRNKGVKDDHSYFKGSPIKENATLKRIFAQIFSGDDAEKSLDYHADLNVYRS